ncbi:hypothetical protein F5J12DRAFT_783040 [Pisolithus orientalis]|uniref:uncharacterized protein n=1 Tax=Pisolithus orientalis TaxID=936130 RepID=UPI0022247886|nr:uncharacterized protein F5J12DRAFT_783040 [Pisolithus orientalis]KAI6006267.1 hypothetical protein F5J12DRAFT_783040 [Pisolithus orientalis]
MKYIYQADHKKYGEYLGDGQGDVDLDHAVEIDDAENFLAFSHEAYNEDIMTFQTMNTQLDQLEEEIAMLVTDMQSQFLPSSIAPTTMDWPIFRDKGYLELTDQGEGSHDGLDISHHVPPELDT